MFVGRSSLVTQQLLTGLTFVATATGINYIFEGKSQALVHQRRIPGHPGSA